MSATLRAAVWPGAALGEALTALAAHSGLRPRSAPPPPALPAALGAGDGGAAGRAETGVWLEAAAATMGLEAEPVEVPYGEVEALLRRGGPALVRLPGPEGGRVLALLAGSRRAVRCLDPSRRVRQVEADEVHAALCRAAEEETVPEVDRLLDDAGVRGRRRARARRLLLRERLRQLRVRGVHLLGLPPGAGFWAQARREGLSRLLGGVLGFHALQEVLLILSWWVLGRGVLAARLEPGWIAAWALLLLGMVPVRGIERWWLGRLTTGLGALLKRRLLQGALRLDPERVRHQGVGQFLGRVIDSEAVESLILSGGYVGLVAVVELVLAFPILVAGAGGWLHALLLAAWLGLTLALWWRYLGVRDAWTQSRLGITHDLVEKMVGHRTRLAQEAPERWHDGEDEALAGYLERSAALDNRSALLRGVVARGWLLVGILGLTPAFFSGGASIAALAVGVGGVLLAYKALWKLVRGLADLAEAAVAWRTVRPVFEAAAVAELHGDPGLSVVAPGRPERGRGGGDAPAGGDGRGKPLVDARNLVFRYPGRAAPVLQGADLELKNGDRVLLEGPSGGGKSTLAALLLGLRQPDSGVLLLEGLDRGTLGERGWQRRVAAAPQFHENHVLSETFGFNLLMGREWPPRPEDLEEAEKICHELGLGELLERMPAGLQQQVGESGWRLSHGERSRLFIARALLQPSRLVLLDESFAALDPETLAVALRCVLARAPSLLVIAHP